MAIDYKKGIWRNNAIPQNETGLNHMEDGIKACSDAIDSGNIPTIQVPFSFVDPSSEDEIVSVTEDGMTGAIYPDNSIISISYADLKALRDAGALVPGQQYRITDFVTTTVQENTRSAGHQFDIIVVADSTSVLNENARAIRHEGDTYFANSKLEAWQVWYSLDNDVSRFAWADSVNGKGVIYRMIDEFNNDVPYDFKNIQFNVSSVWKFTFADDLTGVSYSNKIGKYLQSGVLSLSFNTFGTNCSSNNFGDSCYSNSFGNNCSSNNFGDTCYSNTFGDSCYSNTFGNNCSSNTFGDSCYSNTFGDSCPYNTFGNYCYSNTFGDSCSSNTFGDSCSSNTFGDSCYSNAFGNYCQYNNFGNYCQYNTFGDSCQYSTFGNSCQYNKITGAFVEHISVDNGLSGASYANPLELYDSEIARNAYQISFKKASSGRYLMLWATDTGTMTGKYKAAATDVSWTAL